jgi:hypothetical protein
VIFFSGVTYNWARDYFPNLVEEDKRTFVSYDGNLYFSSLENIDRGNYLCNVQSSVSSTGRTGPTFPLDVVPHCTYFIFYVYQITKLWNLQLTRSSSNTATTSLKLSPKRQLQDKKSDWNVLPLDSKCQSCYNLLIYIQM